MADERCACHPGEPTPHLQVSFLQREAGAAAYRFSRRHVERLVDGSIYESVRIDGHWDWAIDQDVMPDPHQTWAGLASLLETTGQIDTESAMIVFDLERALHLLSRLHPDAAAVVAARVLNDLDDAEMDLAFHGRGTSDWRRLRAKACAWLTSYLRGHPVSAKAGPSCEKAYRAAR